MVVSNLIQELERLDNISKPLFASLCNNLVEKFYVGSFGNSNGLPTLSMSDDEPLPENKEGKTLLAELKRWKRESIHYKHDSDVYMTAVYEYDDESYDFRYFKLKAVSDEGDCLTLISESYEYIELREHYEAFDNSI
jgi:hypothetical protein